MSTNSFQISGRVVEVFAANKLSDKFTKREFVVACADGKYEQFIKFQLTNDKVNLIDDYRIDDEITVFFNLSGRPSTDRNGNTQYFTNLSVWRLERGIANNDAGNAGTSSSSTSSYSRNDRPAPSSDGGGSFSPKPDFGGGKSRDFSKGKPKSFEKEREPGPKKIYKEPKRSNRFTDLDDEDDMPF